MLRAATKAEWENASKTLIKMGVKYTDKSFDFESLNCLQLQTWVNGEVVIMSAVCFGSRIYGVDKEFFGI